MYGVTLSQCAHQRGQQIGKGIILIDVCTVFLDGVLHGENCGELARLGVQYAHAVNVLNGKVYLLEDFGALASSAKGIDGNGHADAECHEE